MTSPDARRAIMGGATDVGAVRDENEDSFGLWGPEAGDWDFLIAVADGVGGHEHGKQASELSLSAFFSSLTAKPLPRSDAGIRNALSAAIIDANRTVYSAFSGSGTSRPGSTFTCVLSQGSKSYIGHVGDSRAYMIHGGRIFQLSTDHTWVQLQVESGTMTAEEAAASPYRNQVLKVLGAEPNVEPDVVVRPTAPGDLFIVCSDGVTEHVSASQLLAESTAAISAEGLAQTLVALAVAQGGSDNATAVVAGVSVDGVAAKTAAKPETTEIPLLRQPEGSPGAAAARPAPPTVPLPSVADPLRSRRDYRPTVAVGLAALFLVLGVLLIHASRDRRTMTIEVPSEVSRDSTVTPPAPLSTPQASATAVAPSAASALSMDGPVVRRLQSFPLPRAANVVFSHDGSRVAILSRDKEAGSANEWLLECYSVDDGTRLFGTSYYIESGSQIAFSPNDELIYHQFCTTSIDRGGPAAISATRGDTVWRARGKEHFSGGLAVSPNGRHLAAADDDSMAGLEEGGAIYDASNGRIRKRLPKVFCGYRQFTFSPKGSYLATCTGRGVRILRTDDWTVRYVLRDLPAWKLENCGGRLAIIGDEGAGSQVWLVDWVTGAIVEQHALSGLSALSRNATWYVSHDRANGCALHSYPDGRLLQQVGSAETRLVTVSEDGKLLALTQGDDVLIFETLPEYQ